jgi:L-lactate dehydrogenase complex protein LldE
MHKGMDSVLSKQVTLFIPCLMDIFYPQAGRDLVILLKRSGFQVTYPQAQTCCGQPAFNQGFIKEAKNLARRFLTIFETAEVVLCPSGSCTAMVRKHYPDLFSQEPEWLGKAEKMARKIFEASEFLVRFVQFDTLHAAFPFTVTYHDSCHSNRGLGIFGQPRQLLSLVEGLTLTEMESSEACCGFGGLFSQKYPSLSEAIVDEKVKAIINTGARWVVSNDPGCLMHIQTRLRAKNSAVGVKHLVEVLASQNENRDGTI